MKVQAISRNVRISPRKVRLVADAVKPMQFKEAQTALKLMRKRAAGAIAKTLQSAIANATNNAKLDASRLKIADIEVAEGQAFKRFHPSTRGRIHPYKKRSSHIRVVLEEVKTKSKQVEPKKESVKRKEDKKL